MGISIYNIKKWYRMMAGTSISHVNQNIGQCFHPGKLDGYFNNLTEKVLKAPETLKSRCLPSIVHEDGSIVVFPGEIFQYGLGAWDLYLQQQEEIYCSQFLRCANWALENQMETGAWDNFSFVYPDDPYSAMSQGEGASLLIRAWKLTGEDKYLLAAKKALDFMLLPLEQGGTAQYDGEEVVLLEYTHLPTVLNGWIFALIGLYDLVVSGEGDAYKHALACTLRTLEKTLPQYDNGYWSMYDLGGTITSPFYHNLHIAQMQALWQITEREVYNTYNQRWKKYRNKKSNVFRAFTKKAFQKILE